MRWRLLLPLLLLLLPAAAAVAAFLRQQRPPTQSRRLSLERAASPSSTDPAPPSVFVFGLGYVGKRLARDLAARGWRVQGTGTGSRQPDGASKIASFAFDPTAGRLLDADGLAALRGATHLLVSIPPLKLDAASQSQAMDTVVGCYGPQLGQLCPHLRWVGYLSSTSVYGDRGGGWVSEADAPAPVSAQGQARVRAEDGWKGVVEGWDAIEGRPPPRLTVFRLAGIYGPGRSALDTLRRELEREEQGGQGQGPGPDPGDAGAPLLFRVDGERPVSRVHVDDIVRVVRCAMEEPGPSDAGGRVAVYNVADDRPASRLEVFSYAARLLASGGNKRPVTVAPAADEAGARAGVVEGPAKTRTRSNRQPESKRVDNRRVKEELLARCLSRAEGAGPLLLYKGYEAGLTAIWQETGGAAEGAQG